MSRFRIPSWNQPQSFSIYMWQGHDILAKHPIICGRIGMPKPCKSNKGLRTKATSSLFHLSSGVLGLSKQIELSNALRSGSGVALSPALLHDPHDSCRFLGSKLRVCKSNYLGMNFMSFMHESMCFPNALTENKAKQHYI